MKKEEFNLKRNIEHEKELARQLGTDVYCAVLRMEENDKEFIRLLHKILRNDNYTWEVMMQEIDKLSGFKEIEK